MAVNAMDTAPEARAGAREIASDLLQRCRVLERSLGAHPRAPLAHLPTPLEPMDRLSEALGGPRLWVKRDDCTGLSGGGNKTRKLEYLMADARERNADCVITQGATQSNHARQTAAAAARLGMRCDILLEDRTGYRDVDYCWSGNVMLDRLHGAHVERRPGGADMNAEMETFAEALRKEGRRPYVIPGGGSNPVGALGYVNAARELTEQAAAMGLAPGALVHATGSSGTQAGLAAGLAAIESDVDLLGIGVRAPREKQEAMVHDLAVRTMERLGMGVPIPRESVKADCSYVGEGYGIPTEGMIKAVRMAAELEGLLFDPVYSGKGLDGLFDLVRKGRFDGMSDVVFLHTGGSAALFGYREAMTPH